MRSRLVVLFTLAAAASACGGKSSSNTPDAGTPDASDTTPDAPGGGACGEFASPEGTIALPGTFSGTVIGHGADLDVTMGTCTSEPFYLEPKGEDAVVKVTGLTAGTKYGVILRSNDDLAFYVATGCTAASSGPAAGQCALFEDETYGGETGEFTAAGTEAYIVVDTGNDPAPPPTGDYALEVVASECGNDVDCTTPGKNLCVEFQCVECARNFDCKSPSAAVCQADHTCGGAVSQCTGDDGHDSGAGDDGPALATTVAAPTAQTPTVVTAAVCAVPYAEEDWYKVTLAAAGDLSIALDFTGATNNLEIGLFDTAGIQIAAGTNPAGEVESFRADGLAKGTYDIVVLQTEPPTNTAAVPYTMTLSVPDCTTDFDCTTGAKPVCNAAGSCVAGPALCVGDDAGDTTSGGDDGPAGARLLVPTPGTPATATGSVCNSPDIERDLYKVVVASGASLDGQLTWTGTTDLDLRILDATGQLYGESFYKQPESVSLTFLPAGTYYLEVIKFDSTESTASQAYSLSVAVGVPKVCASTSDCAAEYSTQLYRGTCTAGACHFIPAGGKANNTSCDSSDDCASKICSYIPFESNAQRSVCTASCTTTTDCAAVAAGLKCGVGSGLQSRCMPACASDLECGVNTTSGALDAGTPWDYNACAVATGECTLP